MRLDRMLGTLNVCTRSECRRMLRRVTVNGQRAVSPDMNVSERDEIALDGRRLDTRLTRHLMLNKPAGVLTADEDRNCRTVMDLLPPVYRSLGCMPVGRLDKDTTGLLLLTTDGRLAHRLISPKNRIAKVYLARVEGELTEEDIAAFAAGIELKDFTALPAELELLAPDTARVTVFEGKYHQVKRMFGARGKPVTELKRLSFGTLMLENGPEEGLYRELTADETALLYAAAGMAEEGTEKEHG